MLVSEQCLGLDCFKIIPTERLEYYVELDILHWDDRATEWSGKPDKIEIKISVYNARLGTELASSVQSASRKWATFGGDHPQDLLPEPLIRYYESLCRIGQESQQPRAGSSQHRAGLEIPRS